MSIWNLKFNTGTPVVRFIIYILLVVTIALASSVSTYATPNFTTQPITTGYKGPSQLLTVDGNLWYKEAVDTPGASVTHISKMTPSGLTTDYNILALTGSSGLALRNISADLNGRIWFTANTQPFNYVVVGVLDPLTGTATIKANLGTSVSSQTPLVLGGDGNMWMTGEMPGNSKYTLMRMNTTTGVLSKTLSSDTYSIWNGLLATPDGKIAVVDSYYKRLDRFNAATGVYGNTVPLPSGYTYLNLQTTEADGTIWLSGYTTGSEYKIVKYNSTDGFTQYALPPGIALNKLTTGPNNSIWSTDGTTTIYQLNTGGAITGQYALPSGVTNISSLSPGPDNALWFTAVTPSGVVGRLEVSPDFSTKPITTGYKGPSQLITAGGNLWYKEAVDTPGAGVTHISKMTPAGITTDYDIQALTSSSELTLRNIAADLSGKIWFTANTQPFNYVVIGVFDPLAETATIKANLGTSVSSQTPLVLGADGNMWTTGEKPGSGKYALMRTDTTTGLTTSTLSSDTYSIWNGLLATPDGKIWIVDSYYHRLDGFNTSTGVYGSTTPLPSGYAYINLETSEANGNIWLSGYTTGSEYKIVKYNSANGFTEYSAPVGVSPGRFAADIDDSIWFISYSSGNIFRMNSNGTITGQFSAPSGITNISSLSKGPDNALWFTAITPSGVVGRLGY